MNSIRRYLLRALICSLVVGSVVTGGLVYWNAAAEIDELYDKNMQEVANLLQGQVKLHPLHKTTTVERSVAKLENEEDMLIQVWERSALIYSSYPAIPLPLQSKTGQFSAAFQQEPWHIYRTSDSDMILQVAQPYSARKSFVREMAGHMLYPMLAQIPLIGLLIWLAVGESLMPLARISRAIHQRSASSLVPLVDQGIPKEIKPMVQELNALLARLDTALSVQKQFTMDAAHELRTPLAAIKLQLGNLERAKESEQEEALKKLHRGVDRASHLVQQLLILARLEPESSQLNFTSTDIAALAAASVEAFAEIAYAKQLDLGITRSEPAIISGNPDKLRMLVNNLLDNAIRYTPEGGRVDIAVYTDRNEAVIDIKDSGIGIAETEHERIFERFYRVIGTETNGTGLGLSIVKHIVDEHQATIAVTSGIEGKGIGFVVRFPRIKRHDFES